MRRIISCTKAVLVVAALVSPREAHAQYIDVQLGSSPASVVIPNGKLTVPVVVDLSAAGAANIASLTSGMTWGASRLSLDSVRVVPPGWSLSGGVPAIGSVTFGSSSATAFPGTGTMANAYFTAGSAGGTLVSIIPTAALNQAGSSVFSLLRSRNLDVCVANSGKGGDASGDNVVNIVDGQQIARHAVGLSVLNLPSVLARGDVNASGGALPINIIDAQQVARFSVGLSVTAPLMNVEIFSPPGVGSMTVSPSSAQTLAAGNRLQIVATPLASGGADVSGCAGISWTTSNALVATVSASGLVTAIASGTATITAASVTNPGVTQAVSVTVPSAATVLFSENFEQASLAPNGWYDNTTAVLSTSEKFAGNSSAQFRFLAGQNSPTSGGSMRHKFTASPSVYISYYVKYTANWVGSGQAYHPHEFYFMTTADASDWEGPAHSWLTAYLEHNYESGNGLRPMLALQDNKAINTSMGTPSTNLNLTALTENRSVSGCNGMLEVGMLKECFSLPGETPPWYNLKQIRGPVAITASAGPNYKGNWNFVEAYLQMNTVVGGIGLANGVLQYWLNGTLIMSRSDVVFRTGARPTMQFNKLLIAPYIGDGSPADQSMFIDNLVVKTGR